MIIDHIDNADAYCVLHPKFKKAFDFLKDPATATLPAGKVVIDGDDVFANIQDYTTRKPADCRLEAHRKYIDIQFLFKGNEAIGYTSLKDSLVVTEPYSEANDILFFEGIGTPIPFESGHFFILYPQDAHAPGQETIPGDVRKVIIKIKC